MPKQTTVPKESTLKTYRAPFHLALPGALGSAPLDGKAYPSFDAAKTAAEARKEPMVLILGTPEGATGVHYLGCVRDLPEEKKAEPVEAKPETVVAPRRSSRAPE